MASVSVPASLPPSWGVGMGFQGQRVVGALFWGPRGAVSMRPKQYSEECFKNRLFTSRRILYHFPSGHGGQDG